MIKVENICITEDLILQYYSQEELMEYFGIPLISSSFSNPFRKDNKPSCSLYYYKDKLIFKDFARYFWGTWVQVAGLYYGLLSPDNSYTDRDTYFLILDITYKSLIQGENLPKINKIENVPVLTTKVKPDFYVSLRNWNSSDVAYWNPIPISLLNYYNVYAIQKVYYGDIPQPHLESSLLNPTYGYRCGKGNNKWVIYKPFDKEHKWKKNISIDTILGYDRNDITLYDSPKILCSSLKDALSVRLATNNEYETYCYQSENYIPEQLEPNTQLIILDNDKTGIYQAELLSEKFNIPHLILKGEGKDAFDIAKKYGITELRNQICQIL